MSKPYTTGDEYARSVLTGADLANYNMMSPEDQQFWWGTIGADHPNSKDFLSDRMGARDQMRSARKWQLNRLDGQASNGMAMAGANRAAQGPSINFSLQQPQGDQSMAGGLNYSQNVQGQPGGVSRFLGPDYVAMMENLYGTQQQVDQDYISSHVDATEGIRNQTYDPSLIEQRADDLNRISNVGASEARANIQDSTSMADASYQNRAQNLAEDRGNLGGRYGQDVSAIQAADIADAQNYQQDIINTGQGYGGAVRSQVDQNLQQNQGVIDETSQNVQGMYSQYLNQADNSAALMDRMSNTDYHSAALDQAWQDNADDIDARMNAAGMSGSGAMAEALAAEKARLAAQQMNLQFDRDMQIAQMTGQYGMSGADRLADSMNRSQDLTLQQNESALNRNLGVDDRQLQLDLMAQEQFRNAQARGYDRAQNVADVNMGLQRENIDQATGFANTAFQRDMQNMDRYGNIIESNKNEQAGITEGLYSDLFANQQARGQSNQAAQDTITEAQRRSAGDYYNKLANMYHDTAKSTADAAMKYDFADMNRAVNAGSEMAGLYQEQAGVRHQQASGFYDMAGTAGMTYAKGM